MSINVRVLLVTLAVSCCSRVLPLRANVSTARSAKVRVEVRDPAHGLADLKNIYRYIITYRGRHDGRYPSGKTKPAFYEDIILNYKDYGFANFEEASADLTNPDTPYSTQFSRETDAKSVIPYLILDTRSDGSPVGSPKLPTTKDLLAQTTIYNYLYSQQDKDGQVTLANYGYTLALWDDGRVEKIPYDEVLHLKQPKGFVDALPYEAGVSPERCVTYQEYWEGVARVKALPLNKPPTQGQELSAITPDNGGPESLVAFSRLLSFPSRYGIDREELWKNFDLAQEEFTLADVQAGAAKLKLPLELKTLSLDALQKLQAPAIFLTSDDKQLVVLSQLDDKQAIVIDRGLTRIVPRDLLAVRYGGQALVAASALAPAAPAPQVLADDPVRLLWLTSPEQVVTQTVKISNSGAAPLTLQIERPIPGCEKAELSASAIAPGQSATLSLTLRWRSVLKSPTQNVLVFLATNDPRRPRLPIGFKLALPAPP